MKWLNRRINNLGDRLDDVAALVMAVLAVGIVILGSLYLHGEINVRTLINDLYANGGSEFLSIAITVLVIEKLNEQRAKREADAREITIRQEAEDREKRDLIAQMGSPINNFALEAVRVLRLRGWLQDGSVSKAEANLAEADLRRAKLKDINLRGVDLTSADLRHADLTSAQLGQCKLFEADLREAILSWTKFPRANLGSANLDRVSLSQANLLEADLENANLHRANLYRVILRGANLTNANLSRAKHLDTVEFDRNTTLPDGSKYTKDVDLTRFTNPKHKDFWRPNIDPTDPLAPMWWRGENDTTSGSEAYV